MNENIKNLIVAGESYRVEFKRSLEKSFIEEFGTRSVIRNPLIASLLHRIDFIEKVGTGIGRIKQEVEKHGGCTVEINFDTFYTITFRAKVPAHKGTVTTEVKQKAPVEAPVKAPVTTPKTTPITADDRGRERVGENSQNINSEEFQSIFGVNSDEFRSIFGTNILKAAWLIHATPEITAKELAKQLGATKRTVENYLSKLRQFNWIKRIGSDKTGHWKITKK